ncbi:hypothetical protein GMB34_00925 [Turicibacter sanguinis]|uniref:YkyA family protein n=1 Tax=Turicibacter sanguinis TaxID=154288 RepID=UPI0006BEF672|nr:YkyA family protein [Turicibacter sanguinis]MDB8437354.1 YkyA family protein [Turicibacter sanguinis]MDB8458390.1 YkyA family protein [Turicibacter sanguinis]MDB8573704.1 YkyA family protein [Turicibacter sanguinis]MDB8577187.1 YkyA family protein [Turicibacter sanguinis]MDB8582383.1 YkyA family protein [Turicibacter sanguinis]
MKITRIIPILCLLLLVGCGGKGETQVFTILNDQIVSQNKCNENNTQLTDLMAKETEIYNHIIEKGTDSFDDIKGFVEEGQQNVENSKQLLSEYDLCIRGALVDQNKLIKEKDKVKDSTALQEATMLIEQYTIYESSLVDYVESLIRLNEAQAQFYNQLNESTDIQQMEALVTNINTAIDEANIASETHHDALIAFNELYSNYYETYIQ